MLIIFNPVAGRRRAQLLWRVLDVMSANGVRLEIAETQHRGHAIELAHEAIAEVANGLAGSGCRLGIIPLGTANVLAHELGLGFAPLAVAAALAFGRTRSIWPGLATGPAGPRLFVQMVGAGFDAQVVHRLPGRLKRTLGRNAYVLQTLREAARYRFPPIQVRCDDAETTTGSVVVTKGHFYAGRYELAPGTSPGNAGLTVALFDHSGALPALLYGAALPFNLLPRMPGLRLLRAARVEIAGADLLAQADGDPAGGGPLTVTDAPTPIDVVVG